MFIGELIPTRRAVVDINRVCNAKCKMCYYTYEEKKWTKPLHDVKTELILAKKRGNTSVDFTGGEPTLYPNMPEVIRFAESIGLHTCVITNCIALDKIKKIVEAGCSEWLVSIHGYQDKHDELLNLKGAWEKMLSTVDFLNKEGCFVRVNCTLTKYNYSDLPTLARFYIDYVNAKIVNFINFNPHYQWGEINQPEVFKKLNEVQIKVSEVAPYLREAIKILEEHNVWVNVRYYPFCMLKGYETHICNNPQVMFDPYEWDYGVFPKTEQAYLAYARQLQRNINSSEDRCGSCGILNVCGGINKTYAKLHGYSELEPYSEVADHPYHFKKDLEADIIIPAYKPSRNLQHLLMEIVEKSVQPYNIILISKVQSAAKNRNYGLERSKSPYIIMCDDDVCDLPYGWNRTLIDVLRENREIIAVSARLMNPDGTPGRNTANNYDLDTKLVKVDFIPTACCAIRRTDIRFDERYIRAGWEDTDFFMQMKSILRGYLAICNAVKVVHLNEEKNTGGTQNLYNERIFREKWLKKKTAIETIQELINRRDFVEALKLLNVELSQKPDHVELLSLCGLVMFELNQIEEAIECYYSAALLKPDDPNILSKFIEVSKKTGKYTLLEKYLKSMIDANPQIPEYPYILAECFCWQGKFREALQLLEANIEKFPNHEESKTLKDSIAEHIKSYIDQKSNSKKEVLSLVGSTYDQ